MNQNPLQALTQIIHAAAQASSDEAQVRYIVDRVCELLGVDVCSLYRRQSDDSMQLIASHGLLQTHAIVIPPHQGLVGHVLKYEHSINIAEPQQHPDYFYVANSREEEFHSFSGEPLIFRGSVNGVLVVQSRTSMVLDADQQALLSTLAIHLAVLLDSYPDSLVQNENLAYYGISGAPGLAIGRALVQRNPTLSRVRKQDAENPEHELALWREVREKALQELVEERAVVLRELGESAASVVDAHQMLLMDPGVDRRVTEELHTGVQLPWALKKVVEHYSELFRAMDDPYLRARHEDIDHLGDKLYQIWQGGAALEADVVDGPVILVGERITVSAIASLATQQLQGIVCFEGAALSHIAVFANALGIPAVMGVGQLPLKNGELVIVDGEHGEVICAPGDAMLDEYQRLIDGRQLIKERLLGDVQLQAVTLDNVRIALMANSGLAADVAPGLRYGAEGIGLYRTEIPFMIHDSLPSEAEQAAIYRNVFSVYAGKPVYLRTLDIGSDKSLPYLPSVQEENPALGLRGIRYTLDNPSLLVTQLRAAIRAAELDARLYLLLPMISTTDQLDECIELVDETVCDLTAEGYSVKRPKLGIMVEVPACVPLLPFWAKRLDFVSVGTNDLSQYLLATDRNNPLVGRWFDALHPAVLHELARIADITSRHGLPVSICGELAANPVAIAFLVGLGFRQFSMSAAKIPLIKSLIRDLRLSEAETLVYQAMRMEKGEDIRRLGRAYLEDKALPYRELLPATDL